MTVKAITHNCRSPLHWKRTIESYYYRKRGQLGGLVLLRAAGAAEGVPLRQRSVAALGLLLVAGPGAMRKESCMGQCTSLPQLLSRLNDTSPKETEGNATLIRTEFR